MTLCPTPSEQLCLDKVLSGVLEAIHRDETIRLPSFDPLAARESATALHLVGIEPNPFGGSIGGFRYQFEGEDDLLHLFVARLDGEELAPETGQAVASVVLKDVPTGLVWFKPGRYTQHFYLGHELLGPQKKEAEEI